MKTFFEASSVVVVGVSSRPHNLARNIVSNLQVFGFDGLIQLVGARGGVAFGRRIHASVLDLPEPADLAVVLTPARAVPQVLEQCGQRGIQRVIIESSGFGELGGEGDAVQRRLLEVAQRYGIRFIGPNGIGIISIPSGLVVPFARLRDVFTRGGVSLLCQSGGMGIGYLTRLSQEHLGVARFASIGNKLDVDENDLLEYLLADEATRVVVMYLESVSDGRRLLELARGSHKPILIHKANTGRLSTAIANSHTGAMSGDDAVVDAAFAQSGVLRFRDDEAMLRLVKLALQPPMEGDRLAVLSRSGGHAVVTADACEANGFQLAPFPAGFLEPIQRHGRAGVIRLGNPLDLGDVFDFDINLELARRTLALDWVDGLIYLQTYLAHEEGESSRRLLMGLAELGRTAGKPLLICVATDGEEVGWLNRNLGWPVFTDPGGAVRALARMRARRVQVEPTTPQPLAVASGSAARSVLVRCRREGRSPLLHEALDVLGAYGLPLAPARFVPRGADPVASAAQIGLPLAAKLVSGAVSHKTDVGGVRLGLAEMGAVRTAVDDLSQQAGAGEAGAGVLLQRMAPDGLDLVLGGRRDPSFGPVMVVGLGGVWVEILRDVSLGVAPLSAGEVRRMWMALRAAPLFGGYRGAEPLDLDAVVDATLRVASLMLDHPEILELDVNPLRVFTRGRGVWGLDARMRLRSA